MKKFLLVLVLANFSISLAQTPDWNWGKNLSVSANDKQNTHTTDSDGNVYLVGDFVESSVTIGNVTLTNTSEAEKSDAYIFKFTNQGALIWSKQITGNSMETIVSVTTDNVGNLYLIGTAQSQIDLGSTVLEVRYNPYYIAKLNSDGDFIWAIRDSGINEYYYLRDIKVDLSGNVFVSGVSSGATVTFNDVMVSIDAQNNSLNNTRPFVFKFNSEGTAQWGKMGLSEEANVFGSRSNSIAVDNDGAVIMTGEFHHKTLQFGTIILNKSAQNNLSSDMFVVKYDANGNEVWAYNGGSPVFESNTLGWAVTTDINNNIYIGGAFGNTLKLGNTTYNGGPGSQFYLVKYDPAGVIEWVKFPYDSNGSTNIKSLTTDSNANVYVGGLTYASSIAFSDTVKLLNLGTLGAFFVTKYNSAGTPIWAKGVSNFDANNDISINCTSENDLAVSGTFNSTSVQLGAITLNKIGNNRNIFIARLNAPALGTANFMDNSIIIYPNPIRDMLNIQSTASINSYEIYNTLGSTVRKGTFVNESKAIDISSLQSGLYMLRLTDDFGKSIQKKIIKQ